MYSACALEVGNEDLELDKIPVLSHTSSRGTDDKVKAMKGIKLRFICLSMAGGSMLVRRLSGTAAFPGPA